ncbi:hypothetical protein BDB01DRAFT_130800 [Pilobolus umbonatus]|nr:hypothetical protein BDB01DRAFT_130800 [Pilobolus umbonatus]
MEVVQVQPRDSYLHNIYIPTTGTVIRWTFTTKKNNISFGLYRRKGKDPLPNSSETILRVKQQLQKRQMSFSIGETAVKHEHGLVSTNSTQTSSTQSTTNRPRSKSFATAKLKERGLDEIIPIQHTHSCDQKVEGSYVVDEPGNYVLVFGMYQEQSNRHTCVLNHLL